MLFTDMLLWWYGPGWRAELRKVATRSMSILDAFSVGLLTRTLFSPFRQIDAGRVRGSIQVQFRAWFDRSFSRVFGFFVRSIVILTGLLAASFVAIGSLLIALAWLVAPLLPLFGLVVAILGWTL
jgi:hypothetical protein